VPQSSIIVVGNEILRGFTVDTNSNWLAGRLFRCGYPVRAITTIGDVDADIVSAIRDHVQRPELSRIFVCGGLGPTPDDRTYVALGRALDQRLVYRREVGEQMQNLMFIRNLAARRGTAELNAGNRRMAMLPEGATLVRNTLDRVGMYSRFRASRTSCAPSTTTSRCAISAAARRTS